MPPPGQIPPNPAELIETEKMKNFFERQKRNLILLLLIHPVAVVTDALLLTPYIDLNIFVVRQRYSSKNTLGLIKDLYKDGKFKNLAIIINDISLSGYYGYGLRYGYSMGYGYTYGNNYYGKYSIAVMVILTKNMVIIPKNEERQLIENWDLIIRPRKEVF